MKRRSRALSAVVLAPALIFLGACAESGSPGSASQASDRTCFRAEQVSGFTAIDRDTVRVNVGASRIFELELFGPCQDINWSQRIGLRARGGSNWICRGIDAELIVPSAIGPSRCQVSNIRQVSREELEAERAANSRE